MIDLHAHYLSPTLFDLELGAIGVAYDSSSRTFEFPSGSSRPVPEPLADLDARSAWTLAESIDIEVLSPWMDVTGDDLSPVAAAAWCRILNDTTAADIEANDGFRAFAGLPLTDGPAAAAELERAIQELGFVGGAIPSQVNGVDLDDAGLDPLFEAAVSLDAPLFMHPFRVSDTVRLKRYFLNNVCGVPFDTTIAALRLFFSGTLDRWPGLKIVLAHCGGALPFIAGRAAHASHNVSLIDREVDAPAEILERFYYDTVLHDPSALGFAASRVGIERMVVGTDVPFPMQIDSVAGHIQNAFTLGGIGPEAFEVVMRTTPAGLIRL